MTKEEAFALLGVTDMDPLQIRRRYRELIRQIHPDAAGGDPAATGAAQKLTSAYQFLKKEGFREILRRKEWGIRENPNAFVQRTIYMEEDVFGSSVILDTGIRGRFYWDPEMESFTLLLKSVGDSAEHILDTLTEMPPGQEDYRHLKIRLLHLLLQEFIDPYTMIRRLCPDSVQDGENRIYTLPCHLRLQKAWQPLLKQELAARAEGSHILVQAGEATAAVTFPDQAFHYIITPMLLQGSANAVFRVQEHPVMKGRYLPGRLKISVDAAKRKDPAERINAEIRELLRKNACSKRQE